MQIKAISIPTSEDACDTDDDNDGLHDVLDDCQYGFLNWNQSNTSLDYDEDGCKDVEEDTDDDNDGILDENDNCPSGVWIGLWITPAI